MSPFAMEALHAIPQADKGSAATAWLAQFDAFRAHWYRRRSDDLSAGDPYRRWVEVQRAAVQTGAIAVWKLWRLQAIDFPFGPPPCPARPQPNRTTTYLGEEHAC